MNNLARLVIALVLALAAGVANYLWMDWQETRHASFVVARADIHVGDAIKREDLGELKIPGDYDELRRTFIPASGGKSLLVGVRSSREYKPGDLILAEYIRSEIPHWKSLGPFRLVSVGDRVRSGDTYTSGSASNTVTIAATVDQDGNFDAKTERLLDIVAAQSNRDSSAKILAIQLDPTPGVDFSGTELSEADSVTVRLPLQANERGIIVPLKNVESIPEVLVRGSNISFIVDWFDDSAEQLLRTARSQP